MATKKRVLVLNQYYYPDMASTGQILTQLCNALASDFEIHVVTAQSRYAEQKSKPSLLRFHTTETVDGVHIHRVLSFAFPRTYFLLRVLNYLSFVLFSTITVFLIKRPNLVVTMTDPPVIGLLGVLVKWLKRVPLLVIYQDVFPEVGEVLGKLSRPLALLLRVSRKIIFKNADNLVTIGACMKKALVANGAHEERITVIPNWADTQHVYPMTFKDSLRSEYLQKGELLIAHSGNIGLSQDFEGLLDLCASFPQHDFIFIGDGARAEWLNKAIGERQLDNTFRVSFQPSDKLAASLAAADIHLLALKEGLESYIVPSKLYGILAAGRPVLASINPNSDLFRLINEEQVGFAVAPHDKKRLHECLHELQSSSELRQRMGKKARELAETRFSCVVASQQYKSLWYDTMGKR